MDKLSKDEFNNDINEDISITDASGENPNDLPILKYKDKILQSVRENKILIIQGETGCGKTTKVPQFLLEAGLNNNETIGITQPRRIAAVSMAKRVAIERQEPLGKEVGYEVRFEKKFSSSTKIKYMTDGILLNELILDKSLNNYSIIIIDEAHERSLNSDVLLGLLKLIKRETLKIIITSATMNAEMFSKYFNDAPILIIEGRLYPVETIYTKFTNDYISKSIEVIENIHLGNVKGHILVFLTGEEEIERCCEKLKGIDNLIVKPLYGAIDFYSQQDVFNNVRPNERKVIVATNIAETSITIEGIRFVVDSGYVKQSNFISRRGIDILEEVRISKAQAEQRKGRAGRNNSGWCYRLYSENMYDKFIEESLPEIFRKNLSDIYLKLVCLSCNPLEFQFIDQPTKEELERSKKELQDLSLLDNNGKLSIQMNSDNRISDLPIEPCLKKVLLTSLSRSCSVEVMKLISILSETKIFNRPNNLRVQADKKHKEFHDPDGDHFTLLKVFNMWKDASKGNVKLWCSVNFINLNSMKNVENIFNQIQNMMKTKQISNVENNNSRQSIKESIISGFFKNICVKQSKNSYIRVYGRETLYIHPSSCLFSSPPEIVLFHEVRKTKKSYMHKLMKLEHLELKKFPKELKIIDCPDDLSKL